ncbi:MAG: DnaA ATPase domain-containing protein, partial [Longimicrobiales bacterium]
MTPLELNQRFTFDQYVVGQANRLAAAAGRRVAEMPGQAYNPLFIYSGSGLGKTHLLNAIGHHARRLHPNFTVAYYTLENFLDLALELIEAGEREDLRARVERIGFLILDDVQFLADRLAAQDELLRVWDEVSARGGQVVLASDRPPAEINGLDQRLLSRFSGGLIADIGVPDYETRVAIVNRKANEHGHTLAQGVAEALAKYSFRNVRELQGGLNKVIAIQDLDKREVRADEVGQLFGKVLIDDNEFSGFLSDISGVVTEALAQTMPETRLADAILRWQGEGYSTRRLEAALATPPSEAEIEGFLEHYAQDVERLRQIEDEIRVIEPEAPELARGDLFRTPDRLVDAEVLLANIRERNRPLPCAPPDCSFELLTLPPDAFALRAARAVAEQPSESYNPFLVHGPEAGARSQLLAALANALAQRLPERSVAFVRGEQFGHELIQAISHNCVDSWRARYRNAAAFILDEIEGLIGTERAQEELFHLFEELKRRGVQLVFGSLVPPGHLRELDERLRTRLESGLVVGIEEENDRKRAGEEEQAALESRIENKAAIELEVLSTAGESEIDDWFLSREKVVWTWPYL